VALYCRVTLESLLRINEVLLIRKEHIGPAWVEVRRKGGRVERVAISSSLRLTLLERAHKRSGFVFGEGEDGQPPTRENASVRVSRAMKALGLPGVSHHTMRHTGVTLMLEAGINPRVIQHLAGWTTMRMLERYGHIRDAEMARAVQATAEIVERAQTRAQSQTQQADEITVSIENKWRPHRDSNPGFSLERAAS